MHHLFSSDSILPKEIFRLYDIRGKADEQLTPGFAFALGRAFAGHIAENAGKNAGDLTLCVGRDCRLSSPALEEALATGMAYAGAKVRRIGLVPTPALYFSVKHYGADGGIMVTGSHNPKNYNGFKCMNAQLALHGPAILDLYDRIARLAAPHGEIEAPQKFFDITNAYVERIVSVALSEHTRAHSRFKTAWDCGNGAMAAVIAPIVARLPGEHILINAEPDGNFPDHHPDPSEPKNMERLRRVVLENGCDAGFAFDGDGDRLGAVDNNGALISSDNLGFVFARDCVERFPGALCVFDVKTCGETFAAIARAGGNTVMGKTGHSLIKEKMKLSDAVFGAEASGHLFFAEHDGFDDAAFAGLRFLDIMCRRNQDAATLAASLKRGFRTPEWRLDVGEKEKWLLLDRLKNALSKRGEAFCDLDGIRVDDKNGWWVVRVSNTQPAVVIMAECDDETRLRQVIEHIDALCRHAEFDLKLSTRYKECR